MIGGYLLHRQNLKISGMRENNYFSRLVALQIKGALLGINDLAERQDGVAGGS